MSMAQISKGNKTHYAIFPESCFVVDDIFFFFVKNEYFASCSRVGHYLRNSLQKNGVVGFCAFWYKCHKTYF